VQNNLSVQFQIGNVASREETPEVQNSTGEMIVSVLVDNINMSKDEDFNMH